MLGKLATYLRMCGYDTTYVLDDRDGGRGEGSGRDGASDRDGHGSDERNEKESRGTDDPGDDVIADWARESGRTLLTRDTDLAARVAESVLLTSRDVGDQLREVRAAGYDFSLANPPVRCATCNGCLNAIDSDGQIPEYAPDPAETDCWRCPDCGQVFWKGSHWDDVRERLDGL